VQKRVTNIRSISSPLTLSEFKQLILAQIGCSHAEFAPYEAYQRGYGGIKSLQRENT
jgi:hypothetical protein